MKKEKLDWHATIEITLIKTNENFSIPLKLMKIIDNTSSEKFL